MTSASSFSEKGAARREGATGSQAAAQSWPDLPALPRREPPGEGSEHVLLGRPVPPGQPRVLFTWDTFQRIQAHCRSNTSSEVGGALLGKAYQYEGETFVEVKASLPAQSSDHGPIHFTFNADSWSQLHKDRASHHPRLDIVGWFHTHPGLGVFFSGDDVVVHAAAFVLPWHVALVLDPLREEMGLFAWQERKIAPVSGFYGVGRDGSEWDKMPWRVVPAEVWEDTYEEHLGRTSDAHRERRKPNVGERPPDVQSWLGVIAGALGVILSLGLLIGGVLPLSRQNEALHQIVVALGEQNLARASTAGEATCPDPDIRIYAPQPGEEVGNVQELTIVGKAEHPEAKGYQIDLRPAGEQTWWPLGRIRSAESLETLWKWDARRGDASQLPAGTYEIRLAALDGADEPLDGVAPCLVHFQIGQADAASE